MSTMKPRSLKNAYANLPLVDKFVGLVGFALLALVMAWNFDWNMLYSVGTVVGISLAAHVLLTYATLATNVFIILLQLIFAPAAVAAYSLVASGDSVLAYVSNMVLVVLGSLVAFIIATRLPRGRLWVNVLIAFALIDIGGLLVISAIEVKAGAAIGVALAWSYLFLRFLPWHRWLRKVGEIQQSPVVLLSDKQWDKHLLSLEWKTFESDAIEIPLQRLAIGTHGIYALSGIKPGSNLKLVDGRLRYKSVYLEEHFAKMLESAENLSFTARLDHSAIDVVLLVEDDALPTGTQRFFVEVKGVSHTKAISGRIVVCTPTGLKQYDQSKKDLVDLSEKQLTRLEKILT